MKKNKPVVDFVADIAGWCSVLLTVALIALFWGVALYTAVCVLFGAEF